VSFYKKFECFFLIFGASSIATPMPRTKVMGLISDVHNLLKNKWFHFTNNVSDQKTSLLPGHNGSCYWKNIAQKALCHRLQNFSMP
jgi:hypothetical protein